MSTAALKVLLTGDPGCGKTTVMRRVIERLAGEVPVSGFVTEEIREGGRRTGFRGITPDGRDFLLAHVDSPSEIRVGPYGVEQEGLESIGVPALRPGPATRLVVVDEIGKMECFSEAFRRAVQQLLDGETPLLASVASRGVGFVKNVRQDPRVTLLRMQRRSRDAMVGDLLRRLARAGISRETSAPRASVNEQTQEGQPT